MDSYVKTVWKDRVVATPLTYTLATNADGSTTLTPHEGTITEPGVPLTATNLNNIENMVEELANFAVDKRGDVMTGTLAVPSLDMIGTDGTLRHNVITFKLGDTTGSAVAFGGGGSTFIGGGESAQDTLNQTGFITDYKTEQMYVTSDNDVYIWTDMQNIKTDATVGRMFGFTDSGLFLIGGTGIDKGTARAELSYTKTTKTLKWQHNSGTALTDDVILQVGRVVAKQIPVWSPVTFVNNWVNTSTYQTKYAFLPTGMLAVNGHFQGGTASNGADVFHVPLPDTTFTLINGTKVPVMRGDSVIGFLEAIISSGNSIVTFQVSNIGSYNGWISINAQIPMGKMP